MNEFRNHITILRDTEFDFPELYDNEIYYSKIHEEENDNIEYQSNFSIKYLFSGTEKFLVNGVLKTVIGGKMLIVNDESHVINMASISEAFSIFIKPDIINDCLKYRTSEECHLLNKPFDQPHTFPNFYDHVTDHVISSPLSLKTKTLCSPDLIITSDYYYELADELIRSQIRILRSVEKISKLRFATRKEIFRRVELARDYLNDNVHGKFNLDQLAIVGCMSKYQLIRCFKEVYGATPNRYFILNKLHRARNNIITSKDSTLREIAYDFGYPNIGAFSKQFKQFFGYSPSTLLKTG